MDPLGALCRFAAVLRRFAAERSKACSPCFPLPSGRHLCFRCKIQPRRRRFPVLSLFPSVAGEDYTYQIVFSGEDLQPQTFGAAYADGMCSGTAYLPHDTYAVSVVIPAGETPYLVPVATDLKMHPDGSVGWMPVE